jgi:hypothetical protein
LKEFGEALAGSEEGKPLNLNHNEPTNRNYFAVLLIAPMFFGVAPAEERRKVKASVPTKAENSF